MDGFLVFPADPERNSALYAEIMAEDTPLVFVDRYCPALAGDWVVTDNFGASLSAVRRLIADGRRRVAYVTTAETFCSSTQDRRLGYGQALLEAGLPVRPELIRIATAPPRPEARDSARAYAAGVPDAPPLDVDAALKPLLCGRDRVDAVFCVNDWTTLACLHTLRQAGIRVPDEVAVAGFADNDLVTAHLPVPIVAVQQPRDEMGRRAAQILLDRLKGDASGPRQVFLRAAIHEVGGAWYQPSGGAAVLGPPW